MSRCYECAELDGFCLCRPRLVDLTTEVARLRAQVAAAIVLCDEEDMRGAQWVVRRVRATLGQPEATP